MGDPFRRHTVTLPDGRPLSWSIRMERDPAGHFAIEGQPFDGWLDGWPFADDELAGLLATVGSPTHPISPR